jgi:putative tryptophan/tyrosine transport system substrate-binding protein
MAPARSKNILGPERALQNYFRNKIGQQRLPAMRQRMANPVSLGSPWCGSQTCRLERDILAYIAAGVIPLGMGQMAIGIGRRRFITAFGGAAVAWPLAAHAQQAGVPVVGFLGGSSEAERAPFLTGFRLGLKEAGFVDGHDVTIEYRFAEGQYNRLPLLAADLVRRPVNVIFAGDLPSSLAAKAATASIPIVINSGGDVVEYGIVASLSHPGANVTGVNLLAAPFSSKQLEFMHELVPNAKTVALLINPKNINGELIAATVQEAGRVLGVRAIVVRASTKADFETVFATLLQEKVGALLVHADVFFTSEREQLVAMAASHAIPAIYGWREFCLAGGLISYGPSLAAAYHQCGDYVGKILKGAKPADLPVVQPTKIELVINLKTAKALGLTVPQTLQVAADELIE